jgi:hypothetical protein
MVTRREAALAAACRAVVEKWEKGDLAAAVRECVAALEIKSKPTRRQVRLEVHGGGGESFVTLAWKDRGVRVKVTDHRVTPARIYEWSNR